MSTGITGILLLHKLNTVNLIVLLALLLSYMTDGFRATTYRVHQFVDGRAKFSLNLHDNNEASKVHPYSYQQKAVDTAQQVMRTAAVVAASGLSGATVIKPPVVEAIGDLYELKDQSMVLQDVCFNVQNIQAEVDMFGGMFVNRCRQLRFQKSKEEARAVVGFGADYYKSPSTFYPGISDYQEDGGHATISFRFQKLKDNGAEDVVEIFDKGDGLQFVKIGADNIRLSKAIEKGGDIKYAYGWVDLDTPAGIPLEVVVGLVRDPIMLTCLKVSNMKESLEFFTQKLGMKKLSFPLARAVGSQYEQAAPSNSVYVGYSEESMGLLLVPAISGTASTSSGPKKPTSSASSSSAVVNVGTMLHGFTIIVDNRQYTATDLPPLARALLKDRVLGPPSEDTKGRLGNANTDVNLAEKIEQIDDDCIKVLSPDGYPFLLKTLTAFEKEATKMVPDNSQEVLAAAIAAEDERQG